MGSWAPETATDTHPQLPACLSVSYLFTYSFVQQTINEQLLCSWVKSGFGPYLTTLVQGSELFMCHLDFWRAEFGIRFILVPQGLQWGSGHTHFEFVETNEWLCFGETLLGPIHLSQNFPPVVLKPPVQFFQL